MKKIKVLMINRPNGKTLPGGDLVQMEATKTELERLGVQVEVSTSLNPSGVSFDLVHAFNLETPRTTLQQVRHVKKSGIPIFLSTIYWDLGDDIRFTSFFEYGQWPVIKKLVGRFISRQIFNKMYYPVKKQQQSILQLVDGILPNSDLEGQHLAQHFHLPPSLQCSTVANGIRPADWPPGNADNFFKKYGVRDFVLEVGRFGFIKNQLMLLKALRDWNHPIVLAGQPADHRYLELCKKEAHGRRVSFLPHLNRQDLADAYAAARVHALPSYKETVGLVSLEAALYGCRLVSTTNGGGREYLQTSAEYCQPSDLASIRSAIQRAWQRPEPTELVERIRQQYTWQRAAEQTLVAYQQILSAKKTI